MENENTGLRMKVALHCGPLIVGNIGAPGRMNYTVIGDTVNTSSRIEKLAGDLDDGSKVIILLSEQVAERVKGRFKLTPAGEFSVKGRKKTRESVSFERTPLDLRLPTAHRLPHSCC